MHKYILGFFVYLFYKRISLFTLIDYRSFISKKAKVNRMVKIYNSSLESYSYVGSFSEIVCADIGKYCSISTNCSIGLATHSTKNISTSPIFTSKKNGTGFSWTEVDSYIELNRINIGHDVWIGKQVIIMGGIKIGDGAVIGAGAIVTKDIPAYAIAAGIPAKVIKYRFDQQIIDELLKLQWWNMSEDKLRMNLNSFQNEDFTLSDLINFEI